MGVKRYCIMCVYGLNNGYDEIANVDVDFV